MDSQEYLSHAENELDMDDLMNRLPHFLKT